MKATLGHLATRFALGATIGLAVALGLAFGLSVDRTPGLLGDLVAAGTAATAFLLAARSTSTLEATSRAIFGVVAGGALHAVAARVTEWPVPFSVLGAPAGVPAAELPLLYAPSIGAIAAALMAAIAPRKAP